VLRRISAFGDVKQKSIPSIYDQMKSADHSKPGFIIKWLEEFKLVLEKKENCTLVEIDGMTFI